MNYSQSKKMMFSAIFKLTIITTLVTNTFTQPTSNDDGWTLRILHTNDMHARFEQTSALSTKCVPKDAKAGKCYGGFPRIATLVRQAKNSTVPTLFLNAGDTYQGSAWFTVYKWRIVSKLLNLLKPDAISLGNHEFDDEPKGLVPFINDATYPILTCNLDMSGEPELAATNIQKSVVLNVGGKKVGVIGYLTPETKTISNCGNVIILDEIEPIREEVKKLRAQGVNILIALGHSGFTVDKRIAAEVEGLDLVIGGHSNTFLYTGKQPDLEIPEGPYPTVITQKSGRKVHVVQAYAYTKYLGDLSIDFDAGGEIKKITGNPILVNSSIPQAQDILDELDKWRPAIDNLTHTEVGFTKVLLQGNSKECRRRECNLGNLIADSMVEYAAKEYGGTDGWTDAAVAVINSGSIRTSIDRAPNVSVLMSDVLAVLPFNNVIGKVNMTGKRLLEILEFNVDSLEDGPSVDLKGKFLQVSGIQVVYNLLKPVGSRVVSVHIRCAKCRVPTYEKLIEDNTYTVIISDFLHGGGDGFEIFKNYQWTILGITSDQTLVEYFKQKSPVYPGVEWRIVFDNKKDKFITDSACGICISKSVMILVSLISYIFK